MPWLTIFMTLISFFLSKKKTKSNAAAAITAAAVGAGTYFLVEPDNPDALFKLGSDGSKTASEGAATVTGAATASSQTTSGGSGLSDAFGKTVDATGKVLTSWGPTGTAAVVGTAALASSRSLQKYIPWLIVGGVALLILK